MKSIKKYFYITIALLLLVIFALIIKENIVVNASTLTNKVTVFGSCENYYTPDTAYVTIGVETVENELSVAQQNNSNQMSNVITLLNEYGIDSSNIKTTGYKVFNHHNYFEGTKEVESKVLNYVEFKTNNIENLNTLIETLTNNGVNYVNNIRFAIEDTSEEYADALKCALQNAKEKAFALTGNNNLVAIEICENGVYVENYHNNYMLAKNIDSSNNLQSGEIKVCANITVTFEAQ